MKGINYCRFISVYQSQDGGMYYNNMSHQMMGIFPAPTSVSVIILRNLTS